MLPMLRATQLRLETSGLLTGGSVLRQSFNFVVAAIFCLFFAFNECLNLIETFTVRSNLSRERNLLLA